MEPRIVVAVAAAVALHVGSASAQRFDFMDAAGLVSARLNVSPLRMLVQQADGQGLIYGRDAFFDSSDGRYLGFFNTTLNRAVRFPRSGSGPLQITDLDDAIPRFRVTRRVVRPVDALVAGVGIPAWPGVVALPQLGYRPFYPDAYPAGWAPGYGGYFGYRPPRPQSVLIDTRTVENPPLPAARVVLRNDGPRELQVGVVDLRNPSGIRSMRIPRAGAVEVQLERDAGSQQISRYQVLTPLGDIVEREFVSSVPPPIRYEIVVHEWAMQSIAIDRTGKSPNPIEDINFQGRGIGRFSLPPGPELQSGTIEVYQAARFQGNEGSIAPLVPEDESTRDNVAPLEQAIFELQRAAQQK